MPDGQCFECDNGDWVCIEEDGLGDPCAAGGGNVPWRVMGKAWLPIDLNRDHGFQVKARAVPKTAGATLPEHTIEIQLVKVFRERFCDCNNHRHIFPPWWKESWFLHKQAMEEMETEYQEWKEHHEKSDSA